MLSNTTSITDNGTLETHVGEILYFPKSTSIVECANDTINMLEPNIDNTCTTEQTQSVSKQNNFEPTITKKKNKKILIRHHNEQQNARYLILRKIRDL